MNCEIFTNSPVQILYNQPLMVIIKSLWIHKCYTVQSCKTTLQYLHLYYFVVMANRATMVTTAIVGSENSLGCPGLIAQSGLRAGNSHAGSGLNFTGRFPRWQLFSRLIMSFFRLSRLSFTLGLNISCSWRKDCTSSSRYLSQS